MTKQQGGPGPEGVSLKMKHALTVSGTPGADPDILCSFFLARPVLWVPRGEQRRLCARYGRVQRHCPWSWGQRLWSQRADLSVNPGGTPSHVMG